MDGANSLSNFRNTFLFPKPDDPNDRTGHVLAIHFLVIFVFLIFPFQAWSNGDEKLTDREKAKQQTVYLYPSLEHAEDFDLFGITVSIKSVEDKDTKCLPLAYFNYFFNNDKYEISKVPVKISIRKIKLPRILDENIEKPPTGKAIIKVPETQESVEVIVEQVDEMQFTNFLSTLEEKKRKTIKSIFPRDKHSIIFTIQNPLEDKTCFRIMVTQTAFQLAL